MLKNISYLTLAAGLALASCGNKKTTTITDKKTDIPPTGSYVNSSFLDHVADSVPGAFPSYCFEMKFISADSLAIYFGFEEGNFAFKKDSNNYKILNASQQGDMLFTINPDNSITLMDTKWTELATPSSFKKAVVQDGKKWSFDYYLNDKMVGGEYTVYEKDKPTDKKVTFKSNGEVTGWDNYTTYSICYSGDCVGLTNPLSNTIFVQNTAGDEIAFAFKIDKLKQSIGIYNLGESNPDIKGDVPIADLALDLRK